MCSLRLQPDLQQRRSCLGCCAEAPFTVGDEEEPSKETKTHNHTAKSSPGVFVEIWSTSTCEMDNSVAHSQKSLSSINTTSNQTLDFDSQTSSAVGPSNPTDSVNHGPDLWNQTREQWTSNRRTQNCKKDQEPRISWSSTYESLLGTTKPFPQPITLSEMIYFLVETWEQEAVGNYMDVSVI